jgi:hypothetical protein
LNVIQGQHHCIPRYLTNFSTTYPVTLKNNHTMTEREYELFKKESQYIFDEHEMDITGITNGIEALQKQEAIGFAMWVHFNWQHLGDKFFLQKDGLALYTIEEIEKTAITREEMYELYLQLKQQTP